MRRNWGVFLGGFVFGAAVTSGWWLYSHRSLERIPSAEGLDDPRVAQAYGRVAVMPQMALLRRLVARQAAIMCPSGRAVDVGCGPGLLAVELARRVPDLHVTGVDLSEEMLVRGRWYANESGVGERVAFRLGDAGHMPFPDGSLDLVISTLSLHHWRDPVTVLDEIARVLRPGGVFYIIDLRRDMIALAWLLIWLVTHLGAPAALRAVQEPMGSRNAAYTPDEVAELAERSQLTGWRVTSGPLWVTIEGASIGSPIPF